MKKLLLVGLMLVLLAFTVACRDDEETDTPAGPREPVTLRYLNWNLGPEGYDNVETRMIQAFMDAHDWITVELVRPDGDYVEFLNAQAAIGQLPDVFMVADTAPLLINNWLLDITDMSRADAEFNRLPAAVRNATTYGDRVFTVPMFQFMQGYFVNHTLFDELNLNRLQFGLTPEQFLQAIRDTTDLTRPVVGVNYTFHMALWYPAARNSNLGFFTFDGERYNLDSREMIDAVRIATEMNAQGFTFHGIPYDQRTATFDGGWHGEVFNNGQIAMRFEGTWFNPSRYDLDFEWDFIGIPGGRNILILDILGISANTHAPYEAYLLAKWMGHGDAGFERRMDIAEDMEQAVASLPFTNNQALLDRYWASWAGAPGLQAAYRALDNAIIDGNKIVPGHAQARYHAYTGIQVAHYENAPIGGALWGMVHYGSPNFADHATQINNAANQAFQAVWEQLEAALR